MKYFFYHHKLLCSSLLVFALLCFHYPVNAKLIIAQGGGSGYIMGNSLPAVTMAVAAESDIIIKLDTVLTADNEVIVFSSGTLNEATNVADIFPDRIRKDGNYYAIDFTLDEIRQLTLHDPAKGVSENAPPRFTIPSLVELLSLVKVLDSNLEYTSNIAIELKQIWLHRKEGKDLSSSVLGILQQYGYTGEDGNLFLLSYDATELPRIAKQLPQRGIVAKLVQLVDTSDGQENLEEEWGKWNSYNYDWMFTKSGLRSLAGTVVAIALPKNMLVDTNGELLLDGFVKNAQQLGLMVFTFSVQKEDESRVLFTNSFDEELQFFYFSAGIDGIITNYYRDVLDFLKNRTLSPAVSGTHAETVPPSAVTKQNNTDPLGLTAPVGQTSEE